MREDASPAESASLERVAEFHPGAAELNADFGN